MAYTPGRAAHESLRETGSAAFGRPVDNFPAWEAIPQAMRDRMATAGHAELAAYIEANGGDPVALATIAKAAEIARLRDRLDGLMPMGLRFADADPVSVCLVGECKWHGHGDSMNDAVRAWTAHLAADHRLDWPED